MFQNYVADNISKARDFTDSATLTLQTIPGVEVKKACTTNEDSLCVRGTATSTAAGQWFGVGIAVTDPDLRRDRCIVSWDCNVSGTGLITQACGIAVTRRHNGGLPGANTWIPISVNGDRDNAMPSCFVEKDANGFYISTKGRLLLDPDPAAFDSVYFALGVSFRVAAVAAHDFVANAQADMHTMDFQVFQPSK